MSNLAEYALGLPPKDPTSTNRPTASIQGGYLTLTYTRLKSATDVAVTLEQSDDLITWQSGPAYTQQISVVDEDPVQRISVRLITAITVSPSFLRLKVTRL